MPTVKISLSIEVDGQPLAGSPFVRRLAMDEAQAFGPYEKATGGGFVAMPTGELAEIQFFFAHTNRQVTLRLDGQTDAGLVVNAGGLVLLVDVDIDAGALTNAMVDNSGTAIAALRGFVGGT